MPNYLCFIFSYFFKSSPMQITNIFLIPGLESFIKDLFLHHIVQQVPAIKSKDWTIKRNSSILQDNKARN